MANCYGRVGLVCQRQCRKKTEGGAVKLATSRKNPRYANGNLRRKHRARLKAAGGECGICKGKLGAIHYDEPSDAQHPLSFVVDEIIPVSRWREFGYDSARACAEDWNNLQAAHYVCNQFKGNRIGTLSQLNEKGNKKIIFADSKEKKINIIDGDW